MMRVIPSGNEAIARGAYEARVVIATAYPGTPSTEILENVACTLPRSEGKAVRVIDNRKQWG